MSKVSRPTGYKTGHFGDDVPSQSPGSVLKKTKLNKTKNLRIQNQTDLHEQTKIKTKTLQKNKQKLILRDAEKSAKDDERHQKTGERRLLASFVSERRAKVRQDNGKVDKKRGKSLTPNSSRSFKKSKSVRPLSSSRRINFVWCRPQ